MEKTSKHTNSVQLQLGDWDAWAERGGGGIKCGAVSDGPYLGEPG